jgi:histidinol-phosphatase
LSETLGFAHELADIADEISMRYFRSSDMNVRSKIDGTPVTQADEGIERALREAIAARFPQHGVFGEEEGDISGSGDSRWIIDPIDGTKNFTWGIPVWGTLIALETSGQIVCGVASAPALGERYAAGRGLGATRNGRSISVSDVDDLSRARMGFGSAKQWDRMGGGDRFRKLLAMTAHDRGIGDFYGHMLVAAGALDLMIEPQLSPWDLAPLLVIVEEAGGRLTDTSGTAHIYGGSGITTNGRIHEAVLGVLGA